MDGSVNPDIVHPDSPVYSPTEDEADQEPKATDDEGGIPTEQGAAPIYDLTFDDAAGQFVQPIVPEFSFMQFAELGHEGRRDVVHGADLASQTAPLSVRSETEAGVKRGAAHFDLSDAENFEDADDSQDELPFLDCVDRFEMETLPSPTAATEDSVNGFVEVKNGGWRARRLPIKPSGCR